MSDQEKKDELKSEEYYERKSITDNNKSDLSPSPSPGTKGIKDKIVGKISSTTMGKSQEENLSESTRVSNNVRTVILGLFILIAFIILVFAVFTASVGAQLDQVQFANSVFIAAIVGAFTLVGVIVSQISGSNGR
jgi:Fe2+ transport system protein B